MIIALNTTRSAHRRAFKLAVWQSNGIAFRGTFPLVNREEKN